MPQSVPNWTVYSLRDPETQEIRYVGWTSQPIQRRLSNHMDEARNQNSRSAKTYKVRWLKGLLEKGKRPIIEALEVGIGDGWSIAEIQWIARFRGQGTRLTNGSDGGEGNLGYNPPAEVRAKISRVNKGRKLNLSVVERERRSAFSKALNTGRVMPAESVERRAAKLRGIPRPPEVIAKWHAGMKDRVVSQDTREKQRQHKLGTTIPPETRQKMRDAHLGKTPRWTPEGKARILAAMKVRDITPETRERMAEAQRKRPVDMERMKKMWAALAIKVEQRRKEKEQAA